MAGGFGKFMKDQPVLAGCLGALALLMLVSCGFGALLFVGGKAAFDKAADTVGLDGIMATASDASAAGFALSVNVDGQDGTVFSMIPMDARVVSCDELQAVLLPHLTGTLETVKIESQSVVLNDDGSYTTVPLNCEFGDFPGKPATP